MFPLQVVKTEEPKSELESLYARVNASCYTDIAFGFEQPEKVLRRYGFSQDDIQFLLASPAFQQQVDKCRSELTSSGMMFRAKNAMIADSLMQAIYQQASHPNTPLAMKLEAYRTFAKFGNLEPVPAAANAKSAGGVSININFSGKSGGTVSITADAPTETETTEPTTGNTYDMEPTNPMAAFAQLFPEASMNV